jgi:hypothetical protein
MDGADVMMLESGGGPGLVDEAGLGVLVSCEVGRKELESDGAAELGVLGLVDDPIPPSPSFERIL